MRERLQCFFSGTVQGVGFRMTVLNLSAPFAVSGWVRNRRDGRVELCAEGSREELTRFLAAIQDALRGYIDDRVVTWAAATDEFPNFTIAPTE